MKAFSASKAHCVLGNLINTSSRSHFCTLQKKLIFALHIRGILALRLEGDFRSDGEQSFKKSWNMQNVYLWRVWMDVSRIGSSEQTRWLPAPICICQIKLDGTQFFPLLISTFIKGNNWRYQFGAKTEGTHIAPNVIYFRLWFGLHPSAP